MPGVIAAIQTFGTKMNFHPHLHFLLTEDGVDEKEGKVSCRYGKRPERWNGWTEGPVTSKRLARQAQVKSKLLYLNSFGLTLLARPKIQYRLEKIQKIFQTDQI